MKPTTIAGFVWDHCRGQFRLGLCALCKLDATTADKRWTVMSDAEREALTAKMREAMALREADELKHAPPKRVVASIRGAA